LLHYDYDKSPAKSGDSSPHSRFGSRNVRMSPASNAGCQSQRV